MTDRFEEIKERSNFSGVTTDDGLWLIAEVERLRAEKQRQDRIEDAARAWSFSSDPAAGNEFIEIMSANPRPETDTE